MAALRPHLTVHSGGGLHCYWRLEREQEPEEIESLNRRLCLLIGDDPCCTDRGRIMRPPGSFNGKRGRWCRVLRADRSRALVNPDQVRRALADPEPPRRAPAPRSNGYQGGKHDELALIDPPTYFRALAGVELPGGGGMIACPLPTTTTHAPLVKCSPRPSGAGGASAARAGDGSTTWRASWTAGRGGAGCATRPS